MDGVESPTSLVIAAWNLVDPDQQSTVRKMELVFHNVPGNASVTLQRVDDEHGNVLPRYAAMGRPPDRTPVQVEQLNRETAPSAAEHTRLTGGKLELALEPNALVLVKVDR